MLSTLRVERARLQLSLWRLNDTTDAELEPVSQAAGVYQSPINELLYLRARVTNLSGKWSYVAHAVVRHSERP